MTENRRTLGTLLRHLIELLDGDVQATYAALGLDYRPRFTPIVRALMDGPPRTIREIAIEAGITHSAASQTVAEMVRLGLVTSEKSPRDGRERLVTLTAKTEAMLPKLRRCWSATNAAARALGKELGLDLEAEVARAIEALDGRSFRRRLADLLDERDDGAQGLRDTRHATEKRQSDR